MKFWTIFQTEKEEATSGYGYRFDIQADTAEDAIEQYVNSWIIPDSLVPEPQTTEALWNFISRDGRYEVRYIEIVRLDQ